ncbi:ribonuclease III [Oceanivirga salmonicida]|uniref:ribonuclease III n=1 Tax=Oceanivirga salmonicida TaxID=1769291 RepID=UPI00082ADC9C|nr:ribonuclease III [Oceanivirga salmonicida]
MKKIEKLMKKIKYKFNDISLLEQALVHRSYVNENISENKKDNEKLEFLGDSVLNLITTEYIIDNFKKLNEGDLSKIKSQIISEAVFSKISQDIELGTYLYLSKGENLSGGRKRNSILGDAFEALIGAIFLDSDYYVTREVALRFLEDKINHLDEIEGVGDYKTQLQEYVQSVHKVTPKYNLLETSGPDHNKIFRVNVSINEEVIAEGVAKSKKRAEKEAAKKAMEKLGYL